VQPYREWGLKETVADSLGRIGAPAVPALERMLRHPLADRRVEAADILARIGPDAEHAVGPLIDALADEDLRVRKAAARALGQIGTSAAEAVGPLLHLLEETNEALEPPDAMRR
jgi:HEAT repeat protein